MSTELSMMEYRIIEAQGQFTVMDSNEEQVGVYDSKDAAQAEIERCRKEDAVYARAKALVEDAVTTLMREYDLDREMACYWIGSAAELV